MSPPHPASPSVDGRHEESSSRFLSAASFCVITSSQKEATADHASSLPTNFHITNMAARGLHQLHFSEHGAALPTLDNLPVCAAPCLEGCLIPHQLMDPDSSSLSPYRARGPFHSTVTVVMTPLVQLSSRSLTQVTAEAAMLRQYLRQPVRYGTVSPVRPFFEDGANSVGDSPPIPGGYQAFAPLTEHEPPIVGLPISPRCLRGMPPLGA